MFKFQIEYACIFKLRLKSVIFSITLGHRQSRITIIACIITTLRGQQQRHSRAPGTEHKTGTETEKPCKNIAF